MTKSAWHVEAKLSTFVGNADTNDKQPPCHLRQAPTKKTTMMSTPYTTLRWAREKIKKIKTKKTMRSLDSSTHD
jgi:hypothetical protein